MLKFPQFLVAILLVISVILFCFQFHFALNGISRSFQHSDENETNFHTRANSKESKMPEYEIVEIRTLRKREVNNRNNYNNNDEINGSSGSGGANYYNLQFSAFGRRIRLNLKQNNHLISPWFKAWIINDDGNREAIFNGEQFEKNCYFSHREENIVAAMNNCEDNKFVGIIATNEMIFEVLPISSHFKEVLKSDKNETINPDLAYVVRRFQLGENVQKVLNGLKKRRSIIVNHRGGLNITPTVAEHFKNNTARLIKRKAELTVEVGLFFDEAAYNIFASLFDYDDKKLVEMLLAYMNGVQVLYHHPSLGTPIDIVLVHMEIMHKQPKSLPTHNGERDKLLDSFCIYQKRINPPEDNDPNHWDMGLYVSGLDFYGYDKGYNSAATMGLATVRGVCSETYACVIAEFGVTNSFGRPYPSAGFTSVYIMAHEMGHNLGMSHDSSGNYCFREGHIMSPSRGTQGETTWSSCSADIARELSDWADCLNDRPLSTPNEYNAWKYSGYPGQVWSAKKQCELLLTDKDSTDFPTNGLRSICQNLQCRSPHRSGYFFAGPALEGTDCGDNNWCEGGYCSPKRIIPKPENVTKGGWSPWKVDKCKSGCIVNSKGSQLRKRTCTNPVPVNTNEGCEGSSYDVILCEDNSICKNSKRKSIISYASSKCREFSHVVADLDRRGIGLQAPHETTRLWVGCAIFCRRKSTGSFYTPRIELNDRGLDAYFPDGTLCHRNKQDKYYCLQHHCLPENFQFNKNIFLLLSEDIPISGNAKPKPMQTINPKLQDYLSLDKFGKPLLTHIRPEDIDDYQANEMWIDDVDYRIILNL